MATIRSWKETTGVDVFLVDMSTKEKNQDVSNYSEIFLKLENEVSNRVHELDCVNPHIGANADEDENGFIDFLVLNNYKNILTMADMKIDLSAFQASKIFQLPNPDVRKVLPENVEQLWTLNNEVYSGRDYIPVFEEDDHQEFISGIQSENSVCRIAELDGAIAGFVWGMADGESAEILEVSILEKFRRRGLGRLLLGKVLFELKSRGVKEVILETNAENPFGARSLYSSVGFTITKKHLRSRKPVKLANT